MSPQPSPNCEREYPLWFAQVFTGKVFKAAAAVTDEAWAGVKENTRELVIALDMKNLHHAVNKRIHLIFCIAAPLCGEYDSAHLMHG
ncbi:MAG: hypothetical protein RLZZ471_827 [Actinomycetota bacterium]